VSTGLFGSHTYAGDANSFELIEAFILFKHGYLAFEFRCIKREHNMPKAIIELHLAKRFLCTRCIDQLN
jgi:hypothetical protein